MNLKNLFFGALFLSQVVSAQSFASASFSKNPAVSFRRIFIGSFEVTALSDGTVDLPMSKLLTHVTPQEFKKALAKSFLADPTETSVNAYLINTGTKLILVDSGAGTLFGPTLGKMLSNLKAAGYDPDDVDAILITHMHPDHVGGLVANEKRVFSNATLYVDKAEADFWLSTENLAKAPEANKAFFQGAMASVNPYLKAEKVKYLTADTEIVPGVKSRAAHGHTAGHTTYLIESEGKKLMLMGDLAHFAALQFEKPSIRIQFDSDQNAAEKERKLAFKDAAKGGYLVGGVHLSFPGLGHIQQEKGAFKFVPLNYTR